MNKIDAYYAMSRNVLGPLLTQVKLNRSMRESAGDVARSDFLLRVQEVTFRAVCCPEPR